jgi:hypothetical protein
MRRAIKSVLGGLSVLGLGWVAFGAQGCGGPSIRGICEKECKVLSECIDVDCSGYYIDACVRQLDGERDRAEALGCAPEYDELLSCVDGADLSCTDSDTECQAEGDAYHECRGDDV